MNAAGTDLTGHVSLVTGGSSGIGLGLARGLLAAGASVAIWGRSPERNAAALEALDAGDRAWATSCDVGEEDQVERGLAAALERFGRLDSCFANAGMGGADTPFVELTLEDWRAILRTNLDGAFLTTRAAARHMVAAGGGSIVVTSSTASVSGRARGQAYAASKGGIDAMVRGLAVELARHRVRANAILPGWFQSAMTREFLASEPAQRKILPRVPMRRWGTEDDVAGLAVFLAGPASAYMTGQTLVVDGGYLMF